MDGFLKLGGVDDYNRRVQEVRHDDYTLFIRSAFSIII